MSRAAIAITAINLYISLASWLLPASANWAEWDEALAEQGIDLDQTTRVQTYFSQRLISDSSFNPSNQLAQLNEAEFIFELRPDFSLIYKNIGLMLKPRFQYVWEKLIYLIVMFTEKVVLLM